MKSTQLSSQSRPVSSERLLVVVSASTKEGKGATRGVRVRSLGFGEKRRFALQSSRDQFFDPIEGRAHDPGRRTKDAPHTL